MENNVICMQKDVFYPTMLEDAQISMIRGCVDGNLTIDEMKSIWYQIQIRKLDPLARQIYFIRDKNKKIITLCSIDGFRLCAQRTGEYIGQDGPYFCGQDGQWQDVWLEKYPPFASKVGVIRKSFAKTLYSVALWDEYSKKTPVWSQYPTVMLAKAAESLALRKAFPEELSGLYSEAENWISDDEIKKEKPIQVQSQVKKGPSCSFNADVCINLFRKLPEGQQALAMERHLPLLKAAKEGKITYEESEKLFRSLKQIEIDDEA